MEINNAVEFFNSKQGFVFNKQYYKISEVKSVNQKLLIKTDKMSFSKLGNEIDDFIDSVEFMTKNEVKSLVSSDISNQVEVINPDKFWLPESSVKVKNALDDIINFMQSGKAIDKDFIAKANLMCNVADKVVSVEKLQLDYVKLQVNN